MGTAVAKRSIWTVIADNPFPFFDAESFRSQVVERLEAYARRVGGRLSHPPLRPDASEIFRVHLRDVPFPDGPGCTGLEVVAYRAYGRLYLSLIADHDRLFRALDGSTGSRLYLHDYKFVRSYGPDLPPSIDHVELALEGFEHARTTVQVRNRAAVHSRSPLARIRIALRSTLSSPLESSHADTVQEVSAHRVAHRRARVLEALKGGAGTRPEPRKIPVRRRRPDDDKR